jgi:hypothetical protein
MPFAFLIVGLVLVISAVRGTSSQLLTLLKGDFTGSNNFTAWMLAILLVGSLGYIKQIQPLSRAFLVLLVIVLLLSNGGFFAKFEQQYFSKSNSGA